jgi:hypothetical protein
MLIGWGNTAAFEFPDDVWALDLSGIPAWTELAPTAPAPSGRWYAEGAYDSGHARLVMFGGRFISGEMPNDTWALGLGETPAWEQLAPGRAAPSFRGQHTLVFDAERHRIVTFGGVSLNPPPYNDVWTMSAPYTGSWSLVQPSGTPPITRFAHTAIVDAPRDRMIVFGGRMGTTTTTNANDLWELSLEGAPAWTPLSPTGTPPTGRSSHTAIYDPVRERMIVFGGRAGSGSGVNVNDTWELSLSGTPTWTPITTLGTPPPPMFNHSAIYDPVGDRMIVSKSQQTWALSLSGSPTWSLLSSSGPDLTSHTAIYYPVGYRMLAYGDSNPWEFDLTTNVWRQFSTTGSVLHRMGEHASVLDPDLCRMVVFAGLLGQTRNDLYWLQLPTALDVPRAGSASPLDLRLRPNPARGAIVIEFVAPHPGPVTIRVFDLAGREVNSWVRTGSDVVQRIPWDGRARHGKPVAAGIYLCTVESAGARSSKRIALVR